MRDKKHIHEVEQTQIIQNTLKNHIAIEQINDHIDRCRVLHAPGVFDKVQHGNGQQHKGIKGHIPHDRQRTDKYLSKRGIRKKPAYTEEQEKGDIGKTLFRYTHIF